MKRILSVLSLCAATLSTAHACDVCGCSASNQYLGILPQPKYNFVGLQYQYSQFRSSHPSLFNKDVQEQGEDHYYTTQVWGRVNVGKRLQLFAFLPYRSSSSRQNDLSTSQNGMGDISFLANAVLLRDEDTKAGLKHQLIAGGGLKLPTGRYTGITAADRQGLPNMQPGTGSWDFLANANYTVRQNKWGLNADASYTITLPNGEAYKYGNRLSTGLMAFHSSQKGKFTLLPQLGVRYEYSLHDYDNYRRKWLNEQSGGYMCFATAGIQAYYGKVGTRLTWQLPLNQYYGAGYVKAIQKLDAGIFFLL